MHAPRPVLAECESEEPAEPGTAMRTSSAIRSMAMIHRAFDSFDDGGDHPHGGTMVQLLI